MTGPQSDRERGTGAESAARRTLPAHFREKSPLTDTAGVPWNGRDYSVSPFPGDDGTAPPALAAAIDAHRRGEDPHQRGLAATLADARVLVPIMAVATEEGTTAHGLTGDNGADMAMVTLTGADGSRALPVFSSVAALGAWRTDARPVPVVAPQAAQAAVQEGCTALLLDPAADGVIVLRRSILWALAQGRVWTPPWEDPEVIAELDALVPRVPGVLALAAGPHAQREVELRVRLAPGLDADAVSAVVGLLTEALSRSEILADRITSLKMTLES